MSVKSWITPLAWAAVGAAVVGGCGEGTGRTPDTSFEAINVPSIEAPNQPIVLASAEVGEALPAPH